MRTPRLLPALLVTLAALVLPGTAGAADWYVAPSPTGNDANTCGAGSSCATIAHVVNLAGVHDGDTVHLAAGTYNENVQTDKRLTFAGAGAGTAASAAGASVIHSPGTFRAMDLTGGGTVQDVRVVGHDGTGGTDTPGLGLESLAGTPAAYSVRRVLAIGGSDSGASSSRSAVYITSQNAGSTLSADLQDLYAASTLGGGPAFQVQEATGGHATVTMTRATLVPGPAGGGIEGDFAPIAMYDSTVQPASGSTGIGTAGPLTIVRSRVSGGNDAVSWSGGTPLQVIDSLITAAPTTSGRAALNLDAIAPGAQSALIKGSTIVSKTSATGQKAITVTSQAGSSVNVQLVDSIARVRKPDGTAASGFDIQTFLNTPGGVINFSASHSSFSSVSAATGTTLPAAGSTTNLSGDPGFVSWTGANYALAPTSPLIDRGDPAAVTPGELDFTHQPRSLDGNGDCIAAPDVGAYELGGHAGVPPHPAVSGPALAQAGHSVTFTATPATGYTLTWAFSGGGTAAGASVKHAFGVNGTQTATVTATRGGCIGHASRSLTIDGTAPKLSSLSVKHKKLRFKLSEAGSVKVTVLVRKAHSHKYKSLGSFTLKGRKGTNSAKLPKKVHGHRLKAGHYEVKLSATDPAGNRSHSKTKTFTL